MNNQPSDVAVVEDNQKVESYILETLLFTPLSYIQSFDYIEMKVYAPNENTPSMKILRTIDRRKPDTNTPVDVKEIAFQDEVHVLRSSGMDINEAHVISFSIFVDREKYLFRSIHDRPRHINNALGSLEVFKILSTQKSAQLYVGDWRFESDGNGWVRSGKRGDTSIGTTEMTSVVPVDLLLKQSIP